MSTTDKLLIGLVLLAVSLAAATALEMEQQPDSSPIYLIIDRKHGSHFISKGPPSVGHTSVLFEDLNGQEIWLYNGELVILKTPNIEYLKKTYKDLIPDSAILPDTLSP